MLSFQRLAVDEDSLYKKIAMVYDASFSSQVQMMKCRTSKVGPHQTAQFALTEGVTTVEVADQSLCLKICPLLFYCCRLVLRDKNKIK
jgi:hypothetical protein